MISNYEEHVDDNGNIYYTTQCGLDTSRLKDSVDHLHDRFDGVGDRLIKLAETIQESLDGEAG